MRVGLIDIDGTIPNFALMQISAHYKNLGHKTELTKPLFASQYDKIFASKIFTWSETPILPSGSEIGGPAIDLKKNLSDEISSIYPDYSLYNCEFAMGFITRGCIRKCKYCIVPEKEGKIHQVANVEDFWNGQKHIYLLDSNILAHKQHMFLLNQLSLTRAKVKFSQGLDLRLITYENAKKITSIPIWERIYFAWDNIETEKLIKRGLDILRNCGFPMSKIMVYILIGFDTTQEQDLYRALKLREWGIDPYSMIYDKTSLYQRRFTRWVNHKAIFKTVKWEEYRG